MEFFLFHTYVVTKQTFSFLSNILHVTSENDDHDVRRVYAC